MHRIGGAFLATALIAAGSTSALGAIAVLDQQPSFRMVAEVDRLVPGDHEPRVILTAGPPRWAPAHGFRRKPGNKSGQTAKHDHKAEDDARAALPDVGIERGFCDRELIGGILGGVAGGAIGSQVGRGETKTVATIGGTIIGAVIGGTIGRHMDEADHACASQIVAHGETRNVVTWTGQGGARYHVVPLSAAYRDVRGRTCRDFQAIAVVDDVRRSERMTACRRSNGSWQQES